MRRGSKAAARAAREAFYKFRIAEQQVFGENSAFKRAKFPAADHKQPFDVDSNGKALVALERLDPVGLTEDDEVYIMGDDHLVEEPLDEDDEE